MVAKAGLWGQSKASLNDHGRLRQAMWAGGESSRETQPPKYVNKRVAATGALLLVLLLLPSFSSWPQLLYLTSSSPWGHRKLGRMWQISTSQSGSRAGQG